jgi:hypothetical protein
VIAAGAAVSVEGVAAGEGAVIGRAAARPVAAPGGAAAGEGRGCHREGWSLLVRARAVEATERRGWVGEVPAPLPRLSTGRPRASNGHGGDALQHIPRPEHGRTPGHRSIYPPRRGRRLSPAGSRRMAAAPPDARGGQESGRPRDDGDRHARGGPAAARRSGYPTDYRMLGGRGRCAIDDSNLSCAGLAAVMVLAAGAG